MEFGIILRNLAIVGAIVGVVFASQQPWLKTNSKTYTYPQKAATQNPALKGATNAFTGAYSKTTDGLNSLGASVSGGVNQLTPNIHSVGQEIETQKNNLVEKSGDATKKFIAQKFLDALGVKAEDLAKCPTN